MKHYLATATAVAQRALKFARQIRLSRVSAALTASIYRHLRTAASTVRRFVNHYVWVPTSPTVLGVYDGNIVYRQIATRCRAAHSRCLFWLGFFTIPLVVVCTVRHRLAAQSDIAWFERLGEFVQSDITHAASFMLQPRQSVFLISDIWFLAIMCLMMPIHSALVFEIWDTLDLAAAQLQRDSLVNFDDEQFANELRLSRRRFNSPLWHFLAYVGAISIATLMYRGARTGMRWWGASDDIATCGTFIFVVAVAWYQLLWHNFKGLCAMKTMVSWFNEAVLNLDLFHNDGVYGLRLVARVIALSMLSTVLHAIAVLCLVRAGFIPGGVNTLTIVLAAFFVIFLPIFGAWPIYILWRRITALKLASRGSVIAQLKNDSGRLMLAPALLQHRDLVTLGLLAFAIDRLPSHPFRRTATSILIGGYIIQIVSAVLTLLPRPHG